MFCPKCGVDQVGNPAFCRACGERLGTPAIEGSATSDEMRGGAVTDSRRLRCAVHPWDVSRAEVNVSFDMAPVTVEFHSVLYAQLSKGGLSVVQGGSDSRLVIRGRFVRIDQGSRIERYILTFLAGKAVVEVAGELIMDGREIQRLHATKGRSWGLFGGNSEDLLKQCARSCAENVAKEILLALKTS